MFFSDGEEEEDAHDVHRVPVGGVGAVVREGAVPRCVRQGGARTQALSQRGKGAGTSIHQWVFYSTSLYATPVCRNTLSSKVQYLVYQWVSYGNLGKPYVASGSAVVLYCTVLACTMYSLCVHVECSINRRKISVTHL